MGRQRSRERFEGADLSLRSDGTGAGGTRPALEQAAKPFDDAKVRLQVVTSRAAGRRAVETKQVDALLLLSQDRLVFRTDVDAKAAAIADTAVRALRNTLPPTPELTAVTLHRSDAKTTDAETLVAYVGSLLLLMSLAVYGQWVVTGVVEEKNNRVVEIILSTVRPRHLLAGKVIGIGLLGLSQLDAGSRPRRWPPRRRGLRRASQPGRQRRARHPLVRTRVRPLRGRLRHRGSARLRQQNADTAGQPVTYTILAVYFTGYIALAGNADGLLANVLTVFPLSAPLVLPARSALVGVPLWEHVLAVVLVLATTYALVGFAGRVYGQGLLHSGPRLDPRTAWRLARQR